MIWHIYLFIELATVVSSGLKIIHKCRWIGLTITYVIIWEVFEGYLLNSDSCLTVDKKVNMKIWLCIYGCRFTVGIRSNQIDFELWFTEMDFFFLKFIFKIHKIWLLIDRAPLALSSNNVDRWLFGLYNNDR